MFKWIRLTLFNSIDSFAVSDLQNEMIAIEMENLHYNGRGQNYCCVWTLKLESFECT